MPRCAATVEDDMIPCPHAHVSVAVLFTLETVALLQNCELELESA